MAISDVFPNHRLFVQVLRDPSLLRTLAPLEFSQAMDAAQDARLLGWLIARSPDAADAPAWLQDRVFSARVLVDRYDRSLRWEIDRLQRAFHGSGIPWVLLKGAAYLAADLPPGSGRRVADVDVLVPLEQIGAAEQCVKAQGWENPELDAYDARFYREWMHELPPLVHRERGSVVDLHHAILPRTSRLRPPSARLLDRAVEVQPGIRVLCPAHMTVHAAAHLFHDGEIAGAVRDLVDLDGLLRHFGRDPEFWQELVDEAKAMDLARPAYYAVRYAQRLLSTPISSAAAAQLAQWAPPAPIGKLMDALVERTVSASSGTASAVSALALYVRSHWLRMPPLLLARHLFYKRFISK